MAMIYDDGRPSFTTVLFIYFFLIFFNPFLCIFGLGRTSPLLFGLGVYGALIGRMLIKMLNAVSNLGIFYALLFLRVMILLGAKMK